MRLNIGRMYSTEQGFMILRDWLFMGVWSVAGGMWGILGEIRCLTGER